MSTPAQSASRVRSPGLHAILVECGGNFAKIRGPVSGLVAVVFTMIASSVSAQSTPDEVADAYLTRLEVTMRQSASERAVGSLTSLYRPDAIYEHPGVGARIVGRDRIQSGMVAFLGTTRAPTLEEVARVIGADVAIVQFRLTMDMRSGEEWRRVSRVQTTVLEIVDGEIRRIIDYW